MTKNMSAAQFEEYLTDSQISEGLRNGTIFLGAIKVIVPIIIESNMASWLSPEVKASCPNKSIYQDISTVAELEWESADGPDAAQIKRLEESLTALVALLTTFECVPKRRRKTTLNA